MVDAALLEAAAGALVAVGEGASALATLRVGEACGGCQTRLAKGGAGTAARGATRWEEGGGEGSDSGAESIGGRLAESAKDRSARNSIGRSESRHYAARIGLAGSTRRARRGFDDSGIAVPHAQFELAALGRLLHDVVGQGLIDVFADQLRDGACASVAA